jgi:hypothetical protein
MTEVEWLACENPGRMLDLVGTRLGERKLLLFGAAIVRRHPDVLDRFMAWDTVELVEHYAEGRVSEGELAADLARFPELLGALPRLDAVVVTLLAEWLQRLDGRPAVRERERRAQADLLRDIAGNPFRRWSVDPAWLGPGSLVVRLARATVEERVGAEGHLDATRLGILGDALEDAGCCDAHVLSHLRGPGPHVLGCWVVDCLTGRK